MRLILAIFLFSVSSSFISLDSEESKVFHPKDSVENSTENRVELSIFNFSSWLPDTARRVRSSIQYSSRLPFSKDGVNFDGPGLIFLTCKLIRSYSDVDIDKHFSLLIKHAIQVNAP